MGLRDKLVKPIGKDEGLLGLFLVFSTVGKDPGHPIQCPSGIPNIGAQAIDKLVEWNGNRKRIRGPKRKPPKQLCGSLEMFLDRLRVKIMHGLDCWKRWQFIFTTPCECGGNLADNLSRIQVVPNGGHCSN